MTTEDALKQLEPFTSDAPDEALATIRETWPAAEPALLAELDWRLEHSDMEDKSARFLYALFLCAEMKSEAAFERYLALARLPEKVSYLVLGDVLTESMSLFLSYTCHGRTDELKSLSEDQSMDEFARSCGPYALLHLTENELFPRAKLEQYCIDLLSEKLEHDSSNMWDTVITIADKLHLRKALPLIKTAYDNGWANPQMESFESIEASLNRPEGAPREYDNDVRSSLDSTEEETNCFRRQWSEDEDFELTSQDALLVAPAKERKKKKLKSKSSGQEPGRNEPCPCGSGKKYKKCCIETGFIRAEGYQARPEAGPKNRTDEWIMAGFYYKDEDVNFLALTCWDVAWPEVLKAIPESIKNPDDAFCNGLYNGFDFLINWLLDIEKLINDNMENKSIAMEMGLTFFPAVLKHFPDMPPPVVRKFTANLATHECACGKTEAAFARMKQLILDYPETAQSYTLFADLLSFDAYRACLAPNIPKARQLLLQAKMGTKDAKDWGVESRLQGLEKEF